MEGLNTHPFEADLYTRKERVIFDTPDPEKVQLRLMQWNMLADCLCYNFPKVHKRYLEKDFRLPLIIQEVEASSTIINGALRLPPLILFQEMDMKEEIFDRINALDKEKYGEFEYAYEFIAKTGEHKDGLCIFYDVDQYRALQVKKDHYRGPKGDNRSNRVYLMILFEHIETGKKIVVCTLHLKSKKPNRHIRAMEIAEYLTKLNTFCTEVVNDGQVTAEEAKKLPIFVAGDFNDEPDSPIIEWMFDTDLTGGLNFNWAYEVEGVFPEYTTYKYRSEVVTKHVIDYIFYNENAKLLSIREMPEESDMPAEMGNPCHRYPSDHFSTAATFEY